MSDAIEITLPVQPPTITRKESVAGPFTGPQFDAQSKMPNDWKRGRGKLAVTVSTSPWLPKIAGLPVILEYPHGCFEQISTKLLGYSFLANLLAYLPDAAAGDEGRALLAIALHRQDIMPREKEQLLKELDAPIKERAFNPKTLSSATRAEAICALAFDTIAPKLYSPQKRQRIRDRMLALMDSSASLSTQENLWLLLEFKSMIGAEKAEAINSTTEPQGVVSKNGRAVAWLDRKIDDRLLVKGLNTTALTFLMRAEYSTPDLHTDRRDPGFRLVRAVTSLTEVKRTGEKNAPFKLGDQLLITYRMQTRKLQNYVALEDALPAGLEVVNPNLAMIGKFFEMPANTPGDHVLDLSHSEMRDRATLLYFDTFAPGSGVYSVLARATAAGTFRWPATQVVPMYDSRFSGLSPSSICIVAGE